MTDATDIAAAPPRTGANGFTLVEAVIASVIVGVMLVAALNTLGASARARRIQATRSQGPALAGQLMAEILQMPYSDPDRSPRFGPEGSEHARPRSRYDDVDDYHNWSACPPQMKDRTVLTDLAGWRREVTVAYADPADPASGVGSDQGLKRITVTVTDPSGKQVCLVAIRSDVGAYDQPAGPAASVGWVGVTLQIGSEPGAAVVAGTHCLNLPAAGG